MGQAPSPHKNLHVRKLKHPHKFSGGSSSVPLKDINIYDVDDKNIQ